ncbi:MAG: Rossmann-like domain-containing protein [Promethearchaeota archaeon]
MILEKTIDLIKQIYQDHKKIPLKVAKVVIGLGYTGVEVSNYANKSFLGLAATLPTVVNITDCSKIKFAGNLTNKPISELLSWSLEIPSIKKIIGIATLNGLSQHVMEVNNTYLDLREDLLSYLKIEQSSKVMVIGLMKPLIRKLVKNTNLITIIEDLISVPPEFNSINFRTNIEQLKPEELYIDVLFCTGTTLINNTIDKILTLFKRKAQKIAIIGPSASLIPDILFDNGVDIVGGMKISDIEATFKVLQEGGGTKLFKQFGKKYNLIKV